MRILFEALSSSAYVLWKKKTPVYNHIPQRKVVKQRTCPSSWKCATHSHTRRLTVKEAHVVPEFSMIQYRHITYFAMPLAVQLSSTLVLTKIYVTILSTHHEECIIR